jgi:hypothetical protein
MNPMSDHGAIQQASFGEAEVLIGRYRIPCGKMQHILAHAGSFVLTPKGTDKMVNVVNHVPVRVVRI